MTSGAQRIARSIGMLVAAVLLVTAVVTHRWWYAPNDPNAYSKRDTRVGLLSVQLCFCRVSLGEQCTQEHCTGFTMSEAKFPTSYVAAGYTTFLLGLLTAAGLLALAAWTLLRRSTPRRPAWLIGGLCTACAVSALVVVFTRPPANRFPEDAIALSWSFIVFLIGSCGGLAASVLAVRASGPRPQATSA